MQKNHFCDKQSDLINHAKQYISKIHSEMSYGSDPVVNTTAPLRFNAFVIITYFIHEHLPEFLAIQKNFN